MSDDLKENVMDTNIWLRLVFMLVFAVIFGATRLVLVVVIAAQFLWVLFTGKRNDKLLAFGSQLATFIYQIYRYLSFNTEKRPFPFDDFPTAEALLDDSVEEPVKETAEPAPENEAPAEAAEPEAGDDTIEETSNTEETSPETDVEAAEKNKAE
ncbi:hypothetical protein MMIC_P0646 [Mariprofundus micogutta]|uniref:DUF4389 domain-containing protein n=1 Tax=Mariprofundus micogutta TaxID=1921010 RepID=A0A1L8CLD0_9PROT|nr:DUF4389 domain-containing protein [Mariprofundus micogutta]GAV19695.1 hypothetical protein MMIC_P0646 [Mariprofundus micogutta]